MPLVYHRREPEEDVMGRGRRTMRVAVVVLAFLGTGSAEALTGGPDAFGYHFIDSDEPGGPVWTYDDLGALGIDAELADDGAALVDIGFDFTYYGVTYDQVGFQSNGALTFSSSSLWYYNYCLPHPTTPQTTIAIFWDDLYPPDGQALYGTYGTAPFRTFVAQWNDVPRLGLSEGYEFEVVLFETYDDIELRYSVVNAGSPSYDLGASATVGIQADPDNYLQYSCETAALHDELTIRFTTCPEPLGDADGDGFDACIDCDDGEAGIYPGAEEVCDDGLDSDCLGDLEETEVDSDGDGLSECGGDCDDSDPAVFPGADEICNGADDDCDGSVDEDGDGDGWTLCAGDCDDSDPERYPGAAEVCDEIDNDCDDEVDEAIDWDFDGHEGCGGEDCDDANPNAYPGAPEIAGNGVDEDCDGADLPGTGDDDDDDVAGDDDDSAGGGADDDCACEAAGSAGPGGGSLLISLIALIALRRRR